MYFDVFRGPRILYIMIYVEYNSTETIHTRPIESVRSMVDDDVVYEDFTFQTPFTGQAGVRELLSDAMALPKVGLDSASKLLTTWYFTLKRLVRWSFGSTEALEWRSQRL